MNCQLPIFDLPPSFFDQNSTKTASVGERKRRQIRRSTSTTLNLYDSLKQFLGDIYTMIFRDDRSDTSRLKKLRGRRSDGSVANLNASDGSIAKLYLGFVFDNYPKYENISKSLPNITFKLLTQGPQFNYNDNEQAQVFNPDNQEPLKIKVLTYRTLA